LVFVTTLSPFGGPLVVLVRVVVALKTMVVDVERAAVPLDDWDGIEDPPLVVVLATV